MTLRYQIKLSCLLSRYSVSFNPERSRHRTPNFYMGKAS